MKACLLLVEDDQSLGATLRERLEKADYEVRWAKSRAEALEFAKKYSFDLVILDVGLPDGSGFEVAAELKSFAEIPFIFMTAMNSAENRLQGYELGAEEFIPKPFHLKELMLRIQHVLDQHPARARVKLGELVIDLRKMTLESESTGQVEYLASRDFRILKHLIERAPRPVSRDEILDQAWGEDQFPSHRTIDNAIVRIRQQLGDQRGELIRSVRGVGYQWVQKE